MTVNFLLFIISNILLFYICLNVSHFLFKKENIYFRFWISLILYPLGVLSCVLILGCLGMLRISFLITGLFFAALFISIINKEFILLILRQIKTVRYIYYLPLIICTVLAVFMLGNYVLNGTTFGADGLSYHSIFCARTIQSGGLFSCQVSLDAYYPYNAETLSTWFMLPFQNDTYAFLTGGVWFIIFVSTVFHLLYMCTGSLSVSTCGMFLCMLSRHVVDSFHSLSCVDIAGPIMLLVSIVLLLYHIQRAPQQISSFLILSGLSAGYACGCKVSFLLVAIILPILVLLLYFKQINMNYLLLPTGYFVSMVPTCSVWYIHNFLMTHNPLFPAQTLFFDGPLEKSYLETTTIFHRLLNSTQPDHDWGVLLEGFSNWPLSLFVLSVSGYLLAIAMAVFSFKKSKGPVLLLLFLIGLFYFIFHFFMPFSGANHIPIPRFRIGLRFILLSYLFGVILLSLSLGSHKRSTWFLYLITFTALILTRGMAVMNVVFSIGVVAVIMLVPLFWEFLKDKISVIVCEHVFISVFMCSFIGISMAYPSLKEHVDNFIFRHKQIQVVGTTDETVSIDIGPTWESLEKIPEKSRLTWFGGIRPTETYPYFGRQLQLFPVPVCEDGRKKKSLYLTWKETEGQFQWFHSDAARSLTHDELFQNLKDSHVEYVVVVKKLFGWPVQKEFLDKDPRFKMVDSTDCSFIYRLVD